METSDSGLHRIGNSQTGDCREVTQPRTELVASQLLTIIQSTEDVVRVPSPAMADTGPDPDTDNYHQVLIIGGGISGLSAASHLAKNGFKDFRLLEARNRLGGRIATMQIGG